MLSIAVTYTVMLLTLIAVAAYAIIKSRKMDVNSLNNFLSAKNSQGPLALAWCFFASGMGSWTLFSFPEIGVLAGSWGVIGYTLSGCLGMLILAIVGPSTRGLLGEGVTLSDYVFNRFGRVMQVYVALISLFYQFISLASEFTCVSLLVSIISPEAPTIVPVLAVAIITNIYTLVGGLRASLATDVWQGIGVLTLVLLVVIAVLSSVAIPDNAWKDTQIAAFTVPGFETLVTLCIAVTSANLFFTGYWQRVYAAKDDTVLRKACLYTVFMIIPFTLALAISGMVSKLVYPETEVYFFPILIDMGKGWQLLVAIVIASLASSVADSIQIGMAAELVTNFRGLTLAHARLVCVILNVPAIIIALQQVNVLNLFLIADLLCTATVGPMLLGAWSRASQSGAILGCILGLFTILIYGWSVGKTFQAGFEWFLLPEGLYSYNSMMTFIFCLIIPIVVTIVASLALPQTSPNRSSYNPPTSPRAFVDLKSPKSLGDFV